MKKHLKSCAKLFILMLIISLQANILSAQDAPTEWELEAVRNVEKMLDSKSAADIKKFIDYNMLLNDGRDRQDLNDELKEIREEMRGLRDDISVEELPDGALLIVSDGQVEKRLKITFDYKTKLISNLELQKGPQPMKLSIENLAETIDQIELEDMAGVIYLKQNNKIIIQRAFGMANKSLRIPNQLNTIFGTGSKPIDYTIAAIQLLDQKGKISIEDPITKYFEDVPDNKKSIIIKHLMSGQSGFPDFFHNENDWDADLAWVDRSTAIERLLNQELLFEPGNNRSHSHGAFGLLAALVELVSGQSYFDYINENFFEPAGMTRTGEYGDHRTFQISDFAEGGGPQMVGIPNIPPNWGPTSWLIKGSGGMYSTLEDQLKLYKLLRSTKVLDEEHNAIFKQATVNLDGSDRGFELLSAYFPPGNELYLFLNNQVDREKTRQLIRALEKLAEFNE